MNNSNIAEQLARKELIEMVPYQSARRLQAGSENNAKVWLNANEAPGPGIYQINGDSINRYPDFQPDNLLNAYADYCRLPVNNILATRGADEGIELLIRTFCKAYRDNILICPPTYGMYAISAENHGAGIIEVPLVNNELDLDGLAQEVDNTKLVFLCSPGNPTGNLLPLEQIEAALALFGQSAVVVVDEAYIEFCPQSSVSNLLPKYPNLVIVRTLSKAFALAGLRCGFTLASTEIITLLSKVIAPYPVPGPVADIAARALEKPALAQMSVRVKENNILRTELASWLTEQSWCQRVFNSDANFVLFQTQDKDFIFNALTSAGILIRDQSKQRQLGNCLRISIGSARELSLVKQVINQAFSQTLSQQEPQQEPKQQTLSEN
ncbi:histidinol-phosphate transaminase [Thalassomonas sp. RHCl1]|uniref:histidinol-phosphate transaminase n=1 Tax=Thalassomonas sp. RHCl1 TaxID=2995320 RepID=UPI00248AC166|nr:histidinol-phosphate transaminase [Thalassomonas sp. RHCl1]